MKQITAVPGLGGLWTLGRQVVRADAPRATAIRKRLGQYGSAADQLKTKGALIRIDVGGPSAQGGAARKQLTALIDTGASITAIDVGAAKSIGLGQTSSIQVGGVGGVSSQPVFAASIAVPDVGRTYDPIQLVGANLSHPDFQMLLGRNILKEMVLTYDGPNGDYDLGLAGGAQPGTVSIEPKSSSIAYPGGQLPSVQVESGAISLEGFLLGAAGIAVVGAGLWALGLFE